MSQDDVILRLRLGTKEYPVNIRLTDTVAVLESHVRTIVPECRDDNKRLRMIFQGRMLEPATAVLKSFKVVHKGVVQCVVAPRREEAAAAAAALAAPPTTTTNARGFDRLINSGMTADEVAAIRTSFRPEVDMYQQRNRSSPGESSEAFRFRMEEEWMTQQGPASEFVMNVSAFLSDGRENPGMVQRSALDIFLGSGSGASVSSSHAQNFDDPFMGPPPGTTQDFFTGVLFGFFFGFLVLFCAWDRHVSYRHRLGLLTGVTLSIMIQAPPVPPPSHDQPDNQDADHGGSDVPANPGDPPSKSLPVAGADPSG